MQPHQKVSPRGMKWRNEVIVALEQDRFIPEISWAYVNGRRTAARKNFKKAMHCDRPYNGCMQGTRFFLIIYGAPYPLHFAGTLPIDRLPHH